MKNEEKTKQTWLTPEIVDLDIDKTSSGTFFYGSENTASGPSGGG